MKKIIFVFICLFIAPACVSNASIKVDIDANNFPDAKFCRYVQDSFDKNNDMTLSEDEIQKVTQIVINFPVCVYDFQGIEFFTELTNLSIDCSSPVGDSSCRMWTAKLDVSKNLKLKQLVCYMSEIEQLDLTNNVNLEKLTLHGVHSIIDLHRHNKLAELNLRGEKQVVTLPKSQRMRKMIIEGGTININGNFTDYPLLEELQMTNINISMKRINFKNLHHLISVKILKTQIEKVVLTNCINLSEVSCVDCLLKEVQLSGCKKLQDFSCNVNRLKELDLTENKNLKYIDASQNQISKLKLNRTAKYKRINIDKNELKKLNLSQIDVKELSCGNNRLTALSVRKNIESLDCSHNKLKKLEVGKNIESLYCADNNLKYLYLVGRKRLTDLNCEKNRISILNLRNCKKIINLYCNDNKLKKLDVRICEKLMILHCQKNSIRKVQITKIGRWGLNLVK